MPKLVHKTKQPRAVVLQKMRDSSLRRRYGISPVDYAAMLSTQKGRCAICKTIDSGNPYGRFCVDHCHSTLIVRGLLCRNCNNALGHVKDDVSILYAAITYLQETQS